VAHQSDFSKPVFSRVSHLFSRGIAVSARFPAHSGSQQNPSHFSRCRRALVEPAAKLTAALGEASLDAGQYLRRIVTEASQCRECGQPGNIFRSICEHCGAGNPSKVNVSPSMVATGLGCELVLLLV
jgi:hypothetical protein